MIECIYKRGASFYTQCKPKKCVETMETDHTRKYWNKPGQVNEQAPTNDFASSRGVN